MKVLVFCLLFALASCQEHTVTDELLAAQADLTVGHEFAELFLTQNRARLSGYLTHLEEEIIAAFMDSYRQIKIHGIEVREEMDSYTEPSFCKDAVRNRWELQVTRYGQKLAQCLSDARRYIIQFTNELNALHDQSRVYKVVIPNAGVAVLARTPIFDARDSLGQYISDESRDIFFRGQAMRREFEAYIDEISEMRDDYVRQLTSCARGLPRTFENEARQDLESIRLCYGD